MNDWLWDFLGAAPDQRFYEWQLLVDCPGFEALRAQGLLVRDLEAEKSNFLLTKYGQCLDLIRLDGSIFGVDTSGGDDEEPYVEVDPRELIQYYFNWVPWLRTVCEANGLAGESTWLRRNLVFLGEKIYGDRRFSVVLGFLSLPDEAMDLLLSLPARMPPTYDILAVTTLIPQRLPQQDVATLERLGVYVVAPVDRETLEIGMSRLPLKPPDAQPTPATKREGESVPHDGQPLIYITGERGRWNTNTILVNDYPVRLGDKLFALFLRLAVQTMRTGGGGVTRAALRTGGYLTVGAEEQTIGHLKKACTQTLRNLGVGDLIESAGRGSIRLSVAPTLLKYDRDKLVRHGDKKVSRTAEQLP